TASKKIALSIGFGARAFCSPIRSIPLLRTFVEEEYSARMPNVAGGNWRTALFGSSGHRPPGLYAQRSSTPLLCQRKADRNVRLAHRPLACVPCRWAEKIFGESICLSQSFSLAG